MSQPFPEPTDIIETRSEVFERYLDYFRARVVEGVEELPEVELARSRLASGWTPLGLLKHLRYVELRWLEWGFAGIDVADPWGDGKGDHWFVEETETLRELVDALQDQGARSRSIIASNELAAIGQPGPRWDGAAPATLERILFHLLQEYANHLGHLEIVCELVKVASE